jgi:hypothetical protein
MSVVQTAVEVLLAEFGQNDVLTENMRRNLLVLQQIGRGEAYE